MSDPTSILLDILRTDEEQHPWQESAFAVGPPKEKSFLYNWFCCCASGRVGNMVVLWKRNQTTRDGGESTTRPRLLCVVGPHWPILACVTFPLVLGVSTATAYMRIAELRLWMAATWAALTFFLIAALIGVSCCNPGILNRHHESPSDEWIWNDQALTFRPPRAKYDSECACVIEDYDHTCPWTGTAIGRRNLPAFRIFVVLVFVMLICDIFLIAVPYYNVELW